MKSNQTVNSIINYFKSKEWQNVIDVLTKHPEPVHHVHVYVETNVHPMSVEEIVKGYFKKIGYPVERKIELFTSGQDLGSGSIHGIEPKELPHFDLLWRFSPDPGIQPSTKKEHIEFWDESYMENFHEKFPLKTSLTSKEEEELEAYFKTEEWKKYCQLNEQDDVVHIHANVETSVHPAVFKEYALKAMKEQGWEIEEAVPVAFAMRGQMHGKVVFLGNHPEKIFDIAWSYNPTVTMVPSTKYWLTTEHPAYDARTMHDLPLMLKKDAYVQLSLAEIEYVINSI